MPKCKIDFSNPDFVSLEKLDLEPKTLELLVQARIEARTIVDALAPNDITGWPDLIRKLTFRLEQAKSNQKIFNELWPE